MCEDRNLQEDLISVNPLLDAGYRLTMEGNHGTLTNDEAGSSISVVREGARWSVDLRNLASATMTEPSSNDYSNIRDTVEAYAVINADSKSLRLRVISLHERLGHANTEAMCDAVGGGCSYVYSTLKACCKSHSLRSYAQQVTRKTNYRIPIHLPRYFLDTNVRKHGSGDAYGLASVLQYSKIVKNAEQSRYTVYIQ